MGKDMSGNMSFCNFYNFHSLKCNWQYRLQKWRLFGPWGRWVKSATVQQYCQIMIWVSFPNYWPFVRGFNEAAVASIQLADGQYTGALMFALFVGWKCCWTKSQVVGDFKCYAAYVTSVYWIIRNCVTYECGTIRKKMVHKHSRCGKNK